MNLTDAIPGYREAIEREQAVREFAFIDAPRDICGVDVLPLTPRNLLLLYRARSPFVCGGPVDAADIALALWTLSADRAAGGRRWRFIRRCRKLPYEATASALTEFIADSLQDTPGGASSGGPEYVSWVAAIVHVVASAYGWAEAAILDCPLPRLLQYVNQITHDANPARPRFNPSDQLVSRWLKEQNQASQ